MGYRPKTFLSLLGPLRFARGYYHCEHCHRGDVPWDHQLGLTSLDLTPAAEEIVSLAGATEAFEKAARVKLVKMSGLRVSATTVQRTSELAGHRLGEQLQQGEVFGENIEWKWNRDAHGRCCAYVSIDATGVPMQAPDGGKAEGRMAYVGMIYNPVPDDPKGNRIASKEGQARYLAGFDGLDELGLQLRRQACHVGMSQAEIWIALTDGGNGLEAFIDKNFPQAYKILDFWHASEHLANLAKALFPHDEKAWKNQHYQWGHMLKHEGGAALLTQLEAIPLEGRSAEAKEAHRLETAYVRNNVHRMKYPEYLANGWQIGSGPVESACKMVVNQRLCMGGMRWSEYGGDSMCRLRALYRSDSDQWDAFWQRTLAA
jgi:hypothetical protein